MKSMERGGFPAYSPGVILDILDVCAKRWGNVDTRSRRDKEAGVPRLIIPLLARNASGRLIARRTSIDVLERDTHATREM